MTRPEAVPPVEVSSPLTRRPRCVPQRPAMSARGKLQRAERVDTDASHDGRGGGRTAPGREARLFGHRGGGRRRGDPGRQTRAPGKRRRRRRPDDMGIVSVLSPVFLTEARRVTFRPSVGSPRRRDEGRETRQETRGRWKGRCRNRPDVRGLVCLFLWMLAAIRHRLSSVAQGGRTRGAVEVDADARTESKRWRRAAPARGARLVSAACAAAKGAGCETRQETPSRRKGRRRRRPADRWIVSVFFHCSSVGGRRLSSVAPGVNLAGRFGSMRTPGTKVKGRVCVELAREARLVSVACAAVEARDSNQSGRVQECVGVSDEWH
jgi:hypothetical protein